MKMFPLGDDICFVNYTSARMRVCAGETFAVVRHLLTLRAEQRPSSERVDHFLRWIRKDAYEIARSPQFTVVSTCR